MPPGRYDDRSHSRPAMDRRARQARHLPLLPAALLTLALSARAGIAPAVIRPAGARPHGTATSGAPAKLNTVTIQAARERRQVMRQVSRFVASVTISYMYESMPRWDEPICPLVAGLPRAQGDYILARITRVATAAGGTIASEHCRPNLLVVATAYPDRLLGKWWDRDPLMYNTCSGYGAIRAFLHSRRPIRVWYNTVPLSGNGSREPPADLDAPSIGVSVGPTTGCITHGGGTLGLSQVYIVIDMRQITGVSIGQLADYVALTGLAQIQMDTRPAGPSILTLFEHGKAAPHGLSAWDRALLFALYHTSQDTGWDGLLQVSRIRESMVSQLLSSGRKR
jgi:hypothetical protein